MTFKTDQENFWAEAFGKEYINRNKGKTLLAKNLDFFTKALKSTQNIKNCIEFGANIGEYMRGMRDRKRKRLAPERSV